MSLVRRGEELSLWNIFRDISTKEAYTSRQRTALAWFWNLILSSVTQLCPTLCDPMDCSTPGLPIHHQLLELTQNSCPSSQWCNATISSSVVPFSSCHQSFPALGSFQMNQFFTSSSQSIGASASVSVLPMNIQGWFPSDWQIWFSLQSRNSQQSSPAPQFESISFVVLSLLYGPTLLMY